LVQRVLSREQVVGALVSSDLRATTLMVYLVPGASTEQAVERIRDLAGAELGRWELHFAGAPSGLDPVDRSQPRWNTPDGRGALLDEQCTFGAFTAYGDVAPLLQRADDCVVVMRRGDAIALEFAGIGEAAHGFRQTLWLDTELVYKPRVVPGSNRDSALSRNVGPLPHRGMGRYCEDAPQRQDLAYLGYQRRWNTRVYRPGTVEWGEPKRARSRATVTQLHALPLAA
jgi:hypothetical protein